MTDHIEGAPLSDAELEAQAGTALPDKEVVSILDLNADLNLALDLAAPVDLAVAANANVAAPIDAAVSANILSVGSTSQALADQGTMIDQGITGDVSADSTQDSGIVGGADAAPADAPAAATAAPADGTAGLAAPIPDGPVPGLPADGTVPDPGLPTDGTVPDPGLPTDGTLPGGTLPDPSLPTDLGGAMDGPLLNVDVNLAADANLDAPINGAVAANANVAAPIDAAVSANIGSIDSQSVAVAQQDAIINQTIDGDATATADQSSTIQNP
ncbi:hypothetical protein FB382_002573 [Nocardioides ginsengisegetis]|uniref:Peptidoglycan-binding protein n=1 Tax=Nocardioides ginsengisegetis TaxID=661491 RepID=A0A7W3PAB7_9ACTN|nr:peptidoglycan-binding protein [Nocardioides ginsengisegetis]MBA8804282.1 hypothetical protein [Nocardioides ginsengisegetis]